jgi:hypothetical protein
VDKGLPLLPETRQSCSSLARPLPTLSKGPRAGEPSPPKGGKRRAVSNLVSDPESDCLGQITSSASPSFLAPSHLTETEQASAGLVAHTGSRQPPLALKTAIARPLLTGGHALAAHIFRQSRAAVQQVRGGFRSRPANSAHTGSGAGADGAIASTKGRPARSSVGREVPC